VPLLGQAAPQHGRVWQRVNEFENSTRDLFDGVRPPTVAQLYKGSAIAGGNDLDRGGRPGGRFVLQAASAPWICISVCGAHGRTRTRQTNAFAGAARADLSGSARNVAPE
jgi:hypothetical protein